MGTTIRRVAGAAVLAAAVAPGQALAAGHVYTETNQTTGNAIAAYARGSDGSLSHVADFFTGGFGNGAGLGSQGSVVLTGSGWLLAVDAGSNDVAAFRVHDGRLRLIDRAPSGGTTPISVTVDGNRVYVVNAGGDGNISGFTLGAGGLTPLAGSTQPLSGTATGPAEIAFTPSGSELVVTEKSASAIVTYPVGSDGRAAAGTAHASSGATPFGFSFGRHDLLLVSEATASALSSYSLDGGGFATVTASLVNGGAAACWAIATGDGRYVYTANAASDSISGYSIAHDGSVSLITAGGRTGSLPAGTHPTDEAVSRGDGYLYVLGAFTHQINGFEIAADGSLSSLGSFDVLPASDVGLAAN